MNECHSFLNLLNRQLSRSSRERKDIHKQGEFAITLTNLQKYDIPHTTNNSDLQHEASISSAGCRLYREDFYWVSTGSWVLNL